MKAKKAKVEWEIQAILHRDVEAGNVPLVQAWIAVISDKKNISKAVQWLGQTFPLPSSFLFLKRVQPSKEENKAHVIVALDQRPLNYDPKALGLSKDLVSVEVPSRPPLTRQQFLEARELWPCHFHEDKRLESVLNRTLKDIWGDSQMERHFQNMTQTMDFKAQNNAKAAAIAFDPTKTRLVAMAFETEKALRHAAMNLIDSVAHSHGGGAWPLSFHVQPDCNNEVLSSICSCLECSIIIFNINNGPPLDDNIYISHTVVGRYICTYFCMYCYSDQLC